MTYQDGFEKGERDAFADRQLGREPRRYVWPDEGGLDTYQAAQGYRDGYTPRSATWWIPAKQMEAA